MKDVKGAERDSLCCSASSVWLCFVSQGGLQHLCCRAGDTGASYEPKGRSPSLSLKSAWEPTGNLSTKHIRS